MAHTPIIGSLLINSLVIFLPLSIVLKTKSEFIKYNKENNLIFENL